MIKLKALLERINKFHRINYLIENLILEGAVSEWPGTFVIGPDSRVISDINDKIILHGQAIKLYPELYEKAIELFGGKDGLGEAIMAGRDTLYKFMYDNGMIRGGLGGYDSNEKFVAFDSTKIKKDSIMVILHLARLEGNNTHFNVDDVHKKQMYKGITPEKFMQMFL